jgi:hypothetical protein
MLFGSMLPRALNTGLLGMLMLRLIAKKGVITALTRRTLEREA